VQIYFRKKERKIYDIFYDKKMKDGLEKIFDLRVKEHD